MQMVLLAPSSDALRSLLNIAFLEAELLQLDFNSDKTKIMRFHSPSRKSDPVISKQFSVNNLSIETVTTFKYLGFMITDTLSNANDIVRAKNKFYDINFLRTLYRFHAN